MSAACVFWLTRCQSQMAVDIMDEVLEQLIMNCVREGAKSVLTMLDELPSALGLLKA